MKEKYDLVKLSDICEINIGKTPSRNKIEYWNGNHFWLSIGDMGKSKYITNTKEKISDEGAKLFNGKLVKPNTLLFSFKLSIGKVGIAEVPLYTNEAIASLPIKDKSKVDSIYLFYALQNLDLTGKTDRAVMGSTLNKRKLEQIKIPLPDIESQRRIAEILDKADEIVRKRRGEIALTEQLLKSTFLDMFGDPITNPKDWEIKPLKNFGKILTGNTPPRADTDNYGDHIEWIKSDNITIPEHFLSQATEKLSAKGKKLGRVVPKNSILVTCIAGSKSSIGRAGLADREVAFNQQINAIIPNKETNPFFLYGHFFVFQNLVQEKSTDSMKGMVNKTEFSNIEFMKPPKQNQDKFGDFFCNFHRYYKSLKIQLQESENLFNSLLQRAFKGEL